MPFNATVLRVMIASPSDVTKERDIARQAIYQWNDVNAARSSVMLAPVGWETSIAPQMGDRPQALINRELLDHCDLLVGVFWTRLGSPTGESTSGTKEEIDRHLKAHKPAMLYFSDSPAAPSTLDPAQFAQLKAYRDELKDRGLLQFFTNAEEFRSQFGHHLSLTMARDPYIQSLIAEPPEPRAPLSAFTLHEDLSPDVALPMTAPVADLSDDAHELLSIATIIDGNIIVARYLEGTEIQVGHTSLGKTPRESARWRAALDALDRAGLVAQESPDFYSLTHSGWTLGDELVRKAK